jgi:CheY-like chemotaxis protein
MCEKTAHSHEMACWRLLVRWRTDARRLTGPHWSDVRNTQLHRRSLSQPALALRSARCSVVTDTYARLGDIDCRVLVALRDTAAARIIATDLGKDAYATRIVDDGCSIVDAARNYRPAVVAIALSLRDHEGLSACGAARSLRAASSRMQPLLIALSASNAERGRRDVRAAGFDFHLVEPVTADDLDCVIRAGLLRPRRRPTPQAVRLPARQAAAEPRASLLPVAA